MEKDKQSHLQFSRHLINNFNHWHTYFIYLPFVFSSFVSLTENSEKVSVKILRLCFEVISLASVLPFPDESDTGCSELVS